MPPSSWHDYKQLLLHFYSCALPRSCNRCQQKVVNVFNSRLSFLANFYFHQDFLSLQEFVFVAEMKISFDVENISSIILSPTNTGKNPQTSFKRKYSGYYFSFRYDLSLSRSAHALGNPRKKKFIWNKNIAKNI